MIRSPMIEPRTRDSSSKLALLVVLLLVLAPLLLLGCARAPAKGYASSPGGGYGGYYGDDFGEDYIDGQAYVFDDVDLELAESAPPRRELAKQAAPPAPSADPSPVAAAPSAGETSTIVDQPESPPAPTPAPASKRQIIYTATMQVSVHDVAHAVSEAEALPERLGGWLHERVDNHVILRIPAERLSEAMDRIAELGVIDYRLLQALDVTAQYTDLESRIRILTEMQAQLQALLDQAKDVEQALEIRRALDAVTLELELARTQMRELAKSIAFSTLILYFVERGPAVDIQTSNDPFPWVDKLGVEATEYR
jgi:hypothetical protein